MKSLEQILQDYFGCRGDAFTRESARPTPGNISNFTPEGANAYIRMEALLNDLGRLGVFVGTPHGVEGIISKLDAISRVSY